MKFNFPIIIIDEDFRSENASGHGIRDLADAHRKRRHRSRWHDQLRRSDFVRATAKPCIGFRAVHRR